MTDAAKGWQDKWGGFVHPHPVMGIRDGSAYYDATPGMTLRDWFAGQALTGIMANPRAWLDSDGVLRFSEIAYAKADAMLAARAAGDGK